MCINYEVLELDHIVEFTKDATLFIAARENGNGQIRLFLINETTGNAYTRNGRADSWEGISEQDCASLVLRLIAARENRVPVYKVNGEGPQAQ